MQEKHFELPINWFWSSLWDLVDVIGGVSYSPKDIVGSDSDVRIIRGGNIQNNLVMLRDDDVYLHHSYKNETNSLRKWDIVLVASTGSIEALGRTATVWDDMPNVQIGAFLRILRPKSLKYAPLISAWLSSEYYLKYIRTVAKGTSINNISKAHIKGFKIPLPPDNELFAIGDLYTKICKKINLNIAINQNLEAMAKQLYDYWFVQFDFPNEEGKPYKSSGGTMIWNESLNKELPFGWEIGTLDELCTMYQPQTIGTDKLVSNGAYRVYGANGIVGRYDKYNHEESEIAMACRGNSCGILNRTMPYSWITGNAMVIKMKNPQLSNEYVRQAIAYMNIGGAITGSGQPQLTRENLNKVKCIKAKESVILKFSAVIEPFVQKQISLKQENDEIIKQRDELLPLLMNGQVSVTQLNSDLTAR